MNLTIALFYLFQLAVPSLLDFFFLITPFRFYIWQVHIQIVTVRNKTSDKERKGRKGAMVVVVEEVEEDRGG